MEENKREKSSSVNGQSICICDLEPQSECSEELSSTINFVPIMPDIDNDQINGKGREWKVKKKKKVKKWIRIEY